MSAQLVTVSEAAALLGIDKAAVSRQVKKYGLPVDGERRFDFDAYRSLRANAVSPIHGGRRRAGAAPELELADTSSPAPAPVPAATPAAKAAARAPATPTPLMSEHARHKSLQAELLRLQVERERGELVNRAEVDEAVTTLTRQLRDTLLAVPARLAVEVGGAEQARVKVEADRLIREALDTLSDELGRGLVRGRVEELDEE